MFSVARLDASQGVRREKLQKLWEYVKECSETGRAVDIGEAAFTTTLNLLWATLFSVEFAQFNSDTSQEMKGVVRGLMECLGSQNLVDYFPMLKWADPQGILKKMKIYFEKLLAIFDGIIDEKLKSNGGKDDVVEARLARGNGKRKHHAAAGIETTSGTVEWAMTELMRQPDKMSRVRDEIKSIIGEKGKVEESDISRLPYLQAVVKETLRLHPAAPFLVPHKAVSDGEIHGYMVPKDSLILVHVWASGRDPCMWVESDAFMPERFLDNKIDYRGKDFELIPFGAGRRICPGLPLAHRMVHLMLATLIHNFGWEVEIKSKEIDMNEKFGLTLQKDIPLRAVPTKL
ncbi:UNVERIFIED_CONTAM: cytochrome [Sesamum radiatum]|uniref:Cytochrome n=1 Tax=Sesamum radiatum TaxID=300843 RepID=A0AAW2VGS2_SESRA